MTNKSLSMIYAALLILGSLAAAGDALAVCGDVTGEGNTTASDALLVLKQAVGLHPSLTCTLDDLVLDAGLNPLDGTANITSGFLPDPFTVHLTSGGPVHVDYLGACKGFAGIQPDFRVNYTAGIYTTLRFYFLADTPGDDTTIVINSPSNYYDHCDDDSYGTYDPTVDVSYPESGEYDLWIGSIYKGDFVPGTLYVTETLLNHPNP